MTTENTTGAEDEQTTAPPRRTRARRAASAPATTVAPADAESPAPTSAPTRSKATSARSRKAPAGAATTTSAQAPDAATAPGATAPAGTDAGSAPEATEKAPARRRSRRATSATQAPPAQDPADAEAAAAQPQTAPEPAAEQGDAETRGAAEKAPAATEKAPARRATRSRKPKTTPPAQVEDDGGDDVQDDVTSRAGARSSGAAAPGGLDVLAELGRVRSQTPAAVEEPEEAPGDDVTEDADVTEDEGATEEAASSGTATRPTATALLFQAPDPSSRPRRRAQAPAGPPRPVEEEDDTAEASTEDGSDGEPARGDSPARGSGTGKRAGGRSGKDDRGGSGDHDGGDDSGSGEDSGSDGDSGSGEDSGDGTDGGPRRRRRRGGRGRRKSGGERPEDESPEDEQDEGDRGRDAGRGTGSGRDETDDAEDSDAEGDADDSGDGEESGSASSRRRRRRRRSGSSRGEQSEDSTGSGGGGGGGGSSRSRSRAGKTAADEVTALKGSTRLEAKRQRRREGRDAGRRRAVLTEAEFLARRESVERSMVVRETGGRVQIAVLEDDVLVEHFVSRSAQNAQSSMAGNVYLGRVQNVLPSMEAAFVDVGKGRNAVLYAGEVNWDAAGLEGQPRRIEQALKSGDSVLVQVTKDPIGHKGARLTSQVTLAGRYLVYVPGGGMTGISRKLPDTERARLKKLLKEIVPDAAGVIVRTAAEGASDEELRRDVQRLQDQWAAIEKKAKTASAPALLQGEPDLAIRVVRDIFNDDFRSLVVQGDEAWTTISGYVADMAPDLADRVSRWQEPGDVFAAHRIDEQLAKGMDRKVWLPSGGSLVIDRTEAMTVIDVNTGKFTGSGGTLEETVTRNNLEAAEEIVRQLRLRDIGGIIVIDFIDMVLESNRDLVLRRLVECLGRDRTKHQVAEVTSLGLVQMTRKRVGQGLVEAFSETCDHCNGRGFLVHSDPVEAKGSGDQGSSGSSEGGGDSKRSRRKKASSAAAAVVPVLPEAREAVKATLATIAAAAAHAHEHDDAPVEQAGVDAVEQAEGVTEVSVEQTDALGDGTPEPAGAEDGSPTEQGEGDTPSADGETVTVEQ